MPEIQISHTHTHIHNCLSKNSNHMILLPGSIFKTLCLHGKVISQEDIFL